MGMDHYDILEISKSATDDDLKKAFRNLAMKWHPDKNPDHKEDAEETFKQISEAYQELRDPGKRAIIDRSYGEQAVKGEVPSPEAQQKRNPARGANNTFKGFFFKGHKDSSSKATGGRNTGGMGGTWAVGSKCGRVKSNDGVFGWSGDAGEGSPAPPEVYKTTPYNRKLECSLEELYNGCTCKIKIWRNIADINGRKTLPVDEILTIHVQPGWKEKTTITFPKKGEEQQNGVSGDLIFVIDERPHKTFTRDRHDLIMTQKISRDGLRGSSITMTCLDGRILEIPVREYVYPGLEIVVEGEGMPIPKEKGKRGNLRIKFEEKSDGDELHE